jgi:hypothetical protein
MTVGSVDFAEIEGVLNTALNTAEQVAPLVMQ